MTAPSLIVPRFEIELTDKSGHISREWYKFFALLAKSNGTSLTSSDDGQVAQFDEDELFALSPLMIAPYLNLQQTAAEAAANVTPVNFGYAPGNVLRYGADPKFQIDSTAAFVAAGSLGITVHVPAGNYRVNFATPIIISGGGMVGDGGYQSYIYATDTGSTDCFTYTGALAGRFENFQIGALTSKSGGYAITVNPPSGEVSAMRFFQVIVNGLPNAVNFVRASLWSVIGCNFYGYTGNALLVDNQNAGDSGDSVVMGCQFEANNTSGFGIQQVSSGGLKILGCKFNNNSVGYLLNLGTVVGGVSTSDLVINGCSFENSVNSDIQLQRASGTATFQNVNIGNCQILITSASGTGIYSNDSSGFLSNVNITGNVFTIQGVTGATGVLLDYVTNANVDGNIMQGSGGTSTGIVGGIHGTNCRIGTNQIAGFGHSVNATTGWTIAKPDIQAGTVVITTSTGYGALWAGTATVTYPVGFDANVPLVITDALVGPANTANGGISAYATSISNTQVAIEAIGITSGGTVTVNWRVAGVL